MIGVWVGAGAGGGEDLEELEKKEKIEEGEREGDGSEDVAFPVEIFGRRTEEALPEGAGEMVTTPSRTP